MPDGLITWDPWSDDDDPLPPPLHAAHRDRIHLIAAGLVAAEGHEVTREIALDQLFAVQRPSLHGDWTTTCGLCVPADDEDVLLDAAKVVWFEIDPPMPCMVCLRRTQMAVQIGRLTDKLWAAICQSHERDDVLKALAVRREIAAHMALRSA